MSRHRDVRCMNYSEEYEGYDDVYGHSVEDDYCVSPSAEQFLFDRSKQQNIASFIMEPDIIEDNEDSEEPAISSKEDATFSEIEKAKLMSCMESIKNVIGDTVPESEIKKKIIQSNFNEEVALDSILKESSPKNVTESSTVSKDNLEPHPDATSIKPQCSSFIIPKLSFNKQNNIESTNDSASLVNNVGSSRNVAVGNSPMKFSSLSGFTSNPVNFSLDFQIEQNSSKSNFKNTSNTTSFKSLADLTAHHLQNSSDLIGSTNYNGQASLPKTNFVIPKLSIKKDNCGDMSGTKTDLLTTEKKISVELNASNDRKLDDVMDSLEKSLSNVLALSNDFTDSSTKSNLENVDSKEKSILRVSGTRTPSPDPWIIDLSIALKEVTSVCSNNCSLKTSEVLNSSCINNAIPNSTLQTANQNDEISYAILPTTFNLSSMRYVKLPYSKENVSLFGRTLCRQWKLRKPILKIQKHHCDTIKKFDFLVPYSRN